MRMPQSAAGQAASGTAAADAPVASSGAAIVSAPPAAEVPPADAGAKPAASADGTSSRRRRRAGAIAASTLGILRRHWIASALVTAGLVLRILTQMAYHPAIVYIDSLKYLYDAWPGSDPVGYKIPLRLILAVGDLGTVAAVQHLLGLAIAITLYVVLIRRGIPRWLGALAIAPVLLDGYQLQAEHMIMPDVWFEAMIVAGLAVLLWNPKPNLRMIVIGSALLGASTGIRQAGEILIVPALIFAVALGGGWRKVAKNSVAVGGAFVIAVVLYLGASYQLTGHFWISRSSTSLTYGRMAAVADCATLKLPAVEQSLCPTPAQQAMGPDWLDHNVKSPLRNLGPGLPPSLIGHTSKLVRNFDKSVERQQPLRVVTGILRDSVKLFALSRVTSPGDTPIWRWQFQGNFPSYQPWIYVQNNGIYLNFPPASSKPLQKLNPAFGGAPQVDKPIADFLRSYQLGGGYTPGPLFALFVLLGLAGSLFVFARRRLTPARSQLILGCVLFFSTAVAVLAISDVFEFTWRYQLPALVTLPPAGALGIGVLIAFARKSRRPQAADTVSEQAPELAAPAT